MRLNSRPLLTCLLAMIAAAGCDDTFMPIAPTDRNFSIFGYLDASADTQWIRMMPIRSTTLTAPGPLGATVTLENVATGRVVELRDSVFRFLGNPDVGSDGVFLHNYWTTERIEPGATYRFSAKLDAGKTSEAAVAIPPEYQVEVWLAQGQNRPSFVRLVGLRHVAFVETVTYFQDTCGAGVQSIPSDITPTDSDTQMVPLPRLNTYRAGCGDAEIDSRDLFIVGSGAEWPKGRDYATGRLAVPDTMSNVSNSVGYLGGVLTETVPYESCRIINADPTDYCKLRYDATVATLSGTVTDVVCTGEGVAGASVELTELDPVPPAKRKVRFTNTARSGAYTISALETGRYALRVSHTSFDPIEDYLEHTDTLAFAPGEQQTYDVSLRRSTCPSR
jgi:hypothetical protein